jgi:probable addiction module antidote protein
VALSEGLPAFLVALRDVVQANEGVTRTAQAVGVGRESLYKTLSENGNPQFSTIYAVLQSLGFHVSITPNL